MQCTERLRPARPSIDLDEGTVGFKEVVAGGLGVIAGETHEGSDEGISQAFAVQGKKVGWSCGRCAHINDIRASSCESCGRSFVESARLIADAGVPAKQQRATLKAFSAVLGGAVLMRLVAGLISPWAAAGPFGAATIRFLVRYLRS